MTILSNDRMADVFHVVFDFKKGEQPSSAKLTKWVKLTDSAFGLVTRAVGDPWDHQHHAGTIDSATTLTLSPFKLSQPTLARSLGPSELMSPLGESMNAGVCDDLVVSLNINGASSWFFGFPFVRTSGSVGPEMLFSSLQLLDSTDLVFSGDAGLTAYFTDYVDDPRAMTKKGDYYIDFSNGVIQTAVAIDPADALISSTLQVTISNLVYIGAGAPWGTHNVIPNWGDDITTGVSIVEDMAGPGNYLITLPDHTSELPRVGKPIDAPAALFSGSGYPVQDDLVTGGLQTTFTSRPIEGLVYRLPYAITNSFQDGDVFPDGVILLWQNSPGTFIPLTEFVYNSPTQLQLICPVLDDVSTTANTDNYRIIVTGTSLAEHISYLSAVVRDNPGNGLAYGGPASFPSVSYSPPISHDRLRDRFAMTGARGSSWADFIAAFEDWQERFLFVESNVPTNPHPQYMHRAGWMSQDEGSNSGNAMRGELVFASQGEPHVGAGTDVLDLGGQLWDTWGIRFGGGPDSAYLADRQNSGISWLGSRYGKGNLWAGESFDSSFSNLDLHLNFTNAAIGATPWNVMGLSPFTADLEYMYGALAHTPMWGSPLYLRGRTERTYGGSVVLHERSSKGGMIAFDLDGRFEMNYMKLMPADRALWNYAFGEVNTNTVIKNYSACARQLPFLPKLHTSPNVDHDWHGATSLGDIPSYGRWSAGQIREFRLRGVSENTMAMMGHQSISMGEALESGHVVIIDDMPVRNILAPSVSEGYVLFDGNYLPHLYPGAPLKLDGTTGSDGSYYVKWALYLPTVLTTTINKTFVKVGAEAATLVTQTAGGYGTCIGMETAAKFMSPSMVGADYFNVYGNALFFSESGAGGRTSFTDRGALWLDFGSSLVPYVGDQTPSAIFYHPQDDDINPTGSYYAFTLSETGHPDPNLFDKQTRWPLVIGDNIGILGQTTSRVYFSAMSEPVTSSSDIGHLLIQGSDGKVELKSKGAADQLSFFCLRNGSTSSSSSHDFSVTAGDEITVRQGRAETPTPPGIFFYGTKYFNIDLETEFENDGFSIVTTMEGSSYPNAQGWVKPNSINFKHEVSGSKYSSIFLWENSSNAWMSLNSGTISIVATDEVYMTKGSVSFRLEEAASKNYVTIKSAEFSGGTVPPFPSLDYDDWPIGTIYRVGTELHIKHS